jgi:Fic family protein
MSGREVAIRWHGRRVHAWVPDRLTKRDLRLTEAAIRGTEQAAEAARRADSGLPAQWRPLVRLLLRSEGIASSFIEGVRAPLTDVLVAELDRSVSEPAAWVTDNLNAVERAIADARKHALSVRTLHRWHRALMEKSRHLPTHLVGGFRDEQGWIGGTSPLDAALVTPPPARIGALVDDLVAFANRTDVDPVTQAAAVHAQFEAVHPYADGNGRVGRILIAWVLTRRLALAAPPPVSVSMARDRGGYLAGLTQFRLGNVDQWVRWFSGVVRGAGDATLRLTAEIGALQAEWLGRLDDTRGDATARRVVDVLPEHPVCNAQLIAASVGASERAARSALQQLAARDIVERFDPSLRAVGRPHQWWLARELVDRVTAWSR